LKNPYLKLASSGFFALRNDNPENVVYKDLIGTENGNLKLKEWGN
jgi:hypothetical protein